MYEDMAGRRLTYLGGMGAGVTRYGLVQSNTGKIDSGACYTGCSALNQSACQPMEFNNAGEFYDYVRARGENGIILGAAIPDSPAWTAMRDQAFANCGAIAAAGLSPVTPPPPPILQTGPSTPGADTTIHYTAQSLFSPPTGVSTPTIVNVPGGGGVVTLPAPADGTAQPGLDLSSYLPYIIGGGLILLLMRRRG